MAAHDLVIRSGFVVDGTGAPGRTADVAITDGVVTHVGTVDGTGAWARGGLSPRRQARMDAHLATCLDCRVLAAELADVSGGLCREPLPRTAGTGQDRRRQSA